MRTKFKNTNLAFAIFEINRRGEFFAGYFPLVKAQGETPSGAWEALAFALSPFALNGKVAGLSGVEWRAGESYYCGGGFKRGTPYFSGALYHRILCRRARFVGVVTPLSFAQRWDIERVGRLAGHKMPQKMRQKLR